MESAAVPPQDASHAFNDEVDIAPPGVGKVEDQTVTAGETEKKKVVDIKTPKELKESEEAKKDK